MTAQLHPGGRAARRPPALVLGILLVLLAGIVVLSATKGQFPVSARDVLAAIGERIGIGRGPSDDIVDATLWNVRFPRLVLGAVIGSALAVGGALTQGVFGNPLAEPGIIGVSSGCAVGACLVIVLGLDRNVSLVLPAVALAGGLLVTAAVYALSHQRGRANTVMLVLVGIAVNAVGGALVALLVFVAGPSNREQIVFWQMGSLNGATWPAVRDSGIVVAIGLAGALLIRRRLDLLALGERGGAHVGLDVERLKRAAIGIAAVLTAAAVAYAGLIGFVGLVVPHLMRLLLGPAHRFLVPASALAGAILLCGADVLARTLIDFADLPIGIFTALVGAPVFFLLLRSQVRAGDR